MQTALNSKEPQFAIIFDNMMSSVGPSSLSPHHMLCLLLRHEGFVTHTPPAALLAHAQNRLQRLAAEYNELSDAVVNFSGEAAATHHGSAHAGPYWQKKNFFFIMSE